MVVQQEFPRDLFSDCALWGEIISSIHITSLNEG